MKRWLCLLLMLTMLLAACGGPATAPDEGGDQEESVQTPGDDDALTDENQQDESEDNQDGTPADEQDETDTADEDAGGQNQPASQPSTGGAATKPSTGSGTSKPSTGGTTTPSQPSTGGGTTTPSQPAPVAPADDTPSGSLSDLMGKLYQNISVEMPMLSSTVVTADNAEYFTGVTADRFEEALASEAMISAIAHSVVLVKAKSLDDVETLKSDIRNGVNPYKWVCVGVEDENVFVINKGRLIVLIMDNFAPTEIRDNFNALGK